MRRSTAHRLHSFFIMLVLVGWACAGCQGRSAARIDPIGITSVDHLDWLAGHWIQESADGSSVNEELWLAPAGGMMLGVNRTIEGGRAVFFEFLMIREVNGRIAYLAMPGAQSPPTVFPMSAVSAGRVVVFENVDHDFPQRIAYSREGDQLAATLTGRGGDGSPRTETWRWKRID